LADPVIKQRHCHRIKSIPLSQKHYKGRFLPLHSCKWALARSVVFGSSLSCSFYLHEAWTLGCAKYTNQCRMRATNCASKTYSSNNVTDFKPYRLCLSSNRQNCSGVYIVSAKIKTKFAIFSKKETQISGSG
jgi:hypothetical protein